MTASTTSHANYHPTEAERPIWYKRKSVRRKISLWSNTIIILLGALILMVPLAWTDRGVPAADAPLTYEVLIELAGVISAINPRHER